MAGSTLAVEPLTADAFAPFGTVLEPDPARGFAINQGMAWRYDSLAVPRCDPEGHIALSIFRAFAWPRPVRIDMLERHPLGTQAFMPLAPHPWLIVVAREASPGACRAFHARGDQGVQIAANVWHHPLLVLRPSQDFLVTDRRGPGANLEETTFANGGPTLDLGPPTADA
jgi:ureidoglycolate lyase